jgi:PAS domain S-box-containing protein
MKSSETYETLEKVHNQLPYLVSYVDSDFVYKYVNERYSKWFGLPVSEIIGKRVLDLIGPIAYQTVEQYLLQALKGKVVRYETKMPYTNREPVFVRGNLIPDVNDLDDVIGITATIEDFSDIEAAYNKLSTLDLAKTEFLKIISHELNTPLNGIIGFSSLLKENLEGKEDEFLAGQVVDSANRLLKLTKTALLITQLNSKTYQMRANPGNISELIRNTVHYGFTKKNETFEIVVDLPQELPQVCFEPELIWQTVNHLIMNAQKHTDKDTSLIITHEETEDELRIVFNDDGPGFSKDYLNYLFGFFASFDSSKVADERYGLGLAFIRLVMEAHDGQVGLMNNDSGGACVKLHFKNYQCPNSID